MKKHRAVLGIFVSILFLAITFSNAFAGWRTYRRGVIADDTLFNCHINGLSRVLIRGHSTGNWYTTMQLSWWNSTTEEWISIYSASFPSNQEWRTIELMAYEYEDAPVQSRWRVIETTGNQAYVEWFEIWDGYGDPSYQISIDQDQNAYLSTIATHAVSQTILLQELVDKPTASEPMYIITDTLTTTGNEMAISRSFTWGEMLNTIAVGTLTMLALLALVFRSAR